MEQRVLSRSGQEKVRLAADERGDLPVLLSLYTGMRLGEVSALKWTDIDWESAADALDPEEAETNADVFAAHLIAGRAAQEACDQADELVSLAEEANHEIRR